VLVDFVQCALQTVAALKEGRTDIVPAARAPEFGRWLALQGFPAAAVRDTYWTGIRRILDEWSRNQWLESSRDGTGPPDVPLAEVTEFTAAVFDFAERAARYATEAHEQAAAQLGDGGDPRRAELVAALLQGDWDGDPQFAGKVLNYPLDASHLCILIERPTTDDLNRLLARVQRATGARARLAVAPRPQTWTVWLAYAPRASEEGAARLCRELEASGQLTTLGGPHDGLPGFRRAHEEARRACEVRPLLTARGTACLTFHDAALDALVLNDPRAAARYALGQLRELASPTPRAQRTRETVQLWLSTGSQASTAARLGVHENTVRHRLANAGDILGPGYADANRTEVLIALRICRSLGADHLARHAELPNDAKGPDPRREQPGQ
jgi:hypothetical protein